MTQIKDKWAGRLQERLNEHPLVARALAMVLRDIALGTTEPKTKVSRGQDGVCGVVQNQMEKLKLDHDVADYILLACFRALGYDSVDPLGDYFADGDLWAGERGERRRELARECNALMLEHIIPMCPSDNLETTG